MSGRGGGNTRNNSGENGGARGRTCPSIKLKESWVRPAKPIKGAHSRATKSTERCGLKATQKAWERFWSAEILEIGKKGLFWQEGSKRE